MGNGASTRNRHSQSSSRKGSNSSIISKEDASDFRRSLERSSYDRYDRDSFKNRGSDKSLTIGQSDSDIAVNDLGVYGRLVTLGHSAYEVKDKKQVPTGQQNLVFLLKKRIRGNGLKFKRSFLQSVVEEKLKKGEEREGKDEPYTISIFLNQKEVLSHIQEQKILQNTGKKSTPSNEHSVPKDENQQQFLQGPSHLMVEYERDEAFDMFQIGRLPQAQNDVVVPGPTVLQPRRFFTVSRQAARLVCSRDNPRQISIFASGFNSKNKMTIAENTVKWLDRNSQFGWDASTTNGLRVWYPNMRRWCDVSLQGKVRQNGRETECDSTPMIADEAVLSNGCVLDIGCAYLLFEDARAILDAEKFNLRKSINSFDALTKLLCPSFNSKMCLSLALCETSDGVGSNAEGIPWVFTKCGHVTSEGDSKIQVAQQGTQHHKICPVCKMTGPHVRMRIQPCNGIYSSFPTCVFNPCGCVTSLNAAIKWSQCPLRQILHRDFRRCCPFCSTTLEEPRYSTLLVKSVARGEDIVSLEKLVDKLPV